jgi:DNA-binding NarL/FixJ family response regulator
MTVQLIRAVVVDDHPAMRAGIAAVLDQAPDIECCGEAASGAELWPLATASSATGRTSRSCSSPPTPTSGW